MRRAFAAGLCLIALSALAQAPSPGTGPLDVGPSRGGVPLGPDWLTSLSDNPAWATPKLKGGNRLDGWRAQSGDDPAWAQPGFDDRSWPPIALTAQNNESGWRWYRLRTDIPAAAGPLALLITGGDGTYEVYLNGRLLAGPRLRSKLYVTYPRSRVVPLPVVAGSAVIALRTFIPATSMFIPDRGSFRVSLGSMTAAFNAHRAEAGARLHKLLLGLAVYLLVLFAGVPLLTLFWYQPDHREYLWLGVYLIVDAVNSICYDLSTASITPFCLVWFVCTPLNYIQIIGMIEFTFRFVGQPVSRLARFYEAAILVWPLCFILPAWLGLITRNFFNIVEVALFLPGTVAIPILLLVWYRRGNREAGWLIMTGPLPLLTLCLSDIGVLGEYLGSRPLSIFDQHLPLGSFAISFYEMADLLFLLAIGVVMFFRFTRVSQEQARTAAELEAACEIQQRLVPLAVPQLAGYTLDVAYLPAQEVGGDFYQILEQSDGATLIVVGDVSGKCLKAAMTGTLAIGALRALAVEELHPATLLARLNRQILSAQNGGFITCLCARIEPDGSMVLANAGHLAPYLRGPGSQTREIPLDNGLPLGLSPEATYPETNLTLPPNAQLTLLTDGVVEAQSPATRELFGFDRTAAIAHQSAQQIARTAQEFGQTDDITVLTLHYAPAEVAHA